MRNFLVVSLGLMAALNARADFQFNIIVDDFNAVDCFDASTCEMTSATVHAIDFDLNEYAFPADVTLGGNPTRYLAVLTDDNMEGMCGDVWIMSVSAELEGPGFQYSYNYVYDGFPPVIPCGIPALPEDLPVEAGDGCVEFDLPLDWTWENFPNGRVDLLGDFVVEDGEILTIEAGIEVYGLGDYSLTINGEIDAAGSDDAWIMFNGDWDGIQIGSTGSGNISYAHITGVTNELAGGAVRVAGSLNMDHCIIEGNTTTGNGGAVFVDAASVALLFNCTIAYNEATMGGNVYVADTGTAGGLYNILSHGTPDVIYAVASEISSFQFTNFFPLGDLDPEIVPYACDPGYMDAENGDFYLSYWDVEDPSMVNCVIDVSLVPEELDPDGTPYDMGAIPFDQNLVMHPCEIVMVDDRPDDQGGFVLLHFDASHNDGFHLNPVTQYSIWVQYPGMVEDEWVSAGTVAAIGESDMEYVVQIATLDDQYEGMDNIHNFMVGTHSVWFPEAITSNEMTGYSMDNLAPMPVAGLDDGSWYYDAWPATMDMLDLTWAPNSDNDLAFYNVYASLEDDMEEAELIYSGTETATTWQIAIGQLDVDDPVYFWVVAVDEHMNAADATSHVAGYFDVETSLPLSFDLAQNHPNPFNPSTSIAYALPQAADVQLHVYNMNGALVHTLVNDYQSAGNYEVRFDASNLASGVYVYAIQAGSFSDVKKMVLVK